MNILLVDDEEAYRSTLGASIEAEGYQVATAENARSALEVSRGFPPDLLVVDWMLRNSLDGLEVARKLQESAPDLKTILITGYPSSSLRSRARDDGVLAFLEKPFSLDDLLAAIRRAEDARRRRIRNCVGCGLHLPLLRPAPDEQPASFACALCGQRYLAVIDRSFPLEVQANVVPLQPRDTGRQD